MKQKLKSSSTIEINIIKENKKDFMDLLLLADEQEDMIDKYLNRGEMFALYNGDLKSICVITEEANGICEMKNLATYEKYHGQGYGSILVKYILNYYANKCKRMLLGTGDIPWIISFYKSCGFELSHEIENFFTNNYSEPIFEDGVQLIDMVYLKKDF